MVRSILFHPVRHPLNQRQHRKLQLPLVNIPPRLKPLAPIVPLQLPHKIQSFRAEIRIRRRRRGYFPCSSHINILRNSSALKNSTAIAYHLLMTTRREFLQSAGIALAALSTPPALFASDEQQAVAQPLLEEFHYGDVTLAPGRAQTQFEQTQSVLMGMNEDSLLELGLGASGGER